MGSLEKQEFLEAVDEVTEKAKEIIEILSSVENDKGEPDQNKGLNILEVVTTLYFPGSNLTIRVG